MNSTERIHQLFEDITGLRVLVVGDVMIDTYFRGKVDRISPEAPVPIVSVHHEEHRLGGAANVALNIRAMGARATICTVIGDDEKGNLFEKLCAGEGIDTAGVVRSDKRITTVKTRVIGNNHQLLRVDSEDLFDVDAEAREELVKRATDIILSGQADVVVFEDYDKGVLSETVIQGIIDAAGKKGIPTSADPKKKNFLSYRGITLFKPNLKELREGTKHEVYSMKDADFRKAIHELKEKLSAGMVFVTLSEEGVFLTSDENEVHVAAHLRDIADVSGAGDTVISIASLCLALKQDEHTIAFLSNLAGGLVCEKVGVVPVDRDVLLKEALSSINIGR